MGSSEDELDEDDTDWKRSSADLDISHADVSSGEHTGSSFNNICAPTTPQRVILHFDLDCFYAQVEMIRNPALRNVPLGIQQKYIIVTCNYVARDHGVTKLMLLNDAMEKCPHLVLVKGEDLTHYREMSYKVTELLASYCPLVERLGFDENFMDVTELVESRLKQAECSGYSFKGHVYNHADAEATAHPRLALGSHIAEEMRAAMYSNLGLTGCAGVATNKLLAKLVSGTFKPNQQTTLLPENVPDIMGRLRGVHKVPGVGYKTTKKLEALGLTSVQDLQLFPLADLERVFGGSNALRLKNLSLGIDDSPVVPTGAPQSLSDEDSFKKMSSTKEVLLKIQDLLGSLVERMHSDGRQPQTFRLTIRRYTATNKWFSRESRQCPVPNHIGQKITCGSSSSSDAVAQLTSLTMKLFHKMVDGSSSFHLTLINVCFTNLLPRGAAASGKGSIDAFLRKAQSASSQTQDETPPSNSSCYQLEVSTATQSSAAPPARAAALVGSGKACPVVATPPPRLPVPPSGGDPREVSGLPPNSPTPGGTTRRGQPSSCPAHPPCPNVPGSGHPQPQQRCPGDPDETRPPGGNEPPPSSPAVALPPGVDPRVFSELPLDVQSELVSEWGRQGPPLKAPASSSSSSSSPLPPMRKRSSPMPPPSKHRKSARGTQANSLLKYFKPG